jgi:hypothetical protein
MNKELCKEEYKNFIVEVTQSENMLHFLLKRKLINEDMQKTSIGMCSLYVYAWVSTQELRSMVVGWLDGIDLNNKSYELVDLVIDKLETLQKQTSTPEIN